MTNLLDPLVLVLGVSTVAQIGLGVLSWRFRPIPGTRPLTALMATTAIWASGSMLSLLSVSVPANVLATRVAYVGISFVPVAWLFLSLEYAGTESWVTKRTVALANVVPLLTILVAWTNGLHELLWQFDGLQSVGSFVVLSIPSYGPWFWVHTTYSYLLLGVGTVVFLRTIAHAKRIHRYQVSLTLVAVLVPWVSNVTHLSGVSPFTFDPTPFVFIVSGTLFAVALFQYRLLDLPPIARDVVLEDMDDGVVVLDHENRIVDVNPRGEELLDLDGTEVIGRDAAAAFPSRYVERGDDGIRAEDQIVFDLEDGKRILNLRISPLYGRDGWVRGRVLLLRDVTVREEQRYELERQNEQLKRQNEQLEEFADIVSHDLRNPLALARNYLDLLAEERDGEYVDPIADAHEDMAAIIDDLLTLAREGKVVGETRPVPLETVVESVTAVQQDEATVVVADDLFTVDGDPGRVQQLFENLFRNAIEHGSTGSRAEPGDGGARSAPDGRTESSEARRSDAPAGRSESLSDSAVASDRAGSPVTIRVGTLDGGTGFYVEDDGPGIPVEDRERVFTSGYTDDPSGTGFGLAIVENIANAHGWDVAITDGTDGGARFEVTTDTGPKLPDDESPAQLSE